MKEEITPEKIQESFLNGDMSKEDITDLLISLIDGSENANIRAESIVALENLGLKNENLFKILENHLVSDENANVRASAAKVIILNHLEEGLKPLEWTIRHDRSPLVMKMIWDIVVSNKFIKNKIIEENLSNFLNSFASNLGVAYEEARFFLDLEAIFAKGKRNYEINPLEYKNFQVLYNWKDPEPWLVIKDKHVEILNLNFFNWSFIKENRELLDSFLKMKYLDIYLNIIRKYNIFNFNHSAIPESIGRLTSLKKLSLARNNLKSIPGSIKNLNFLSDLDLSHNQLQKIPQILKSLNSLERLNLKNNSIQSTPQGRKDFINSLADFKL
ncbi:MAG: hypothetical protein ACFFG0_37855 [Candidatus Thorarchaeota archaeon]